MRRVWSSILVGSLVGCAATPPPPAPVVLDSAVASPIAVLPALAPVAAEPSAPAEEFGPHDHQLLLNAAGTLSFVENDNADTNSISAQLGLGYFLTREHEIGGQMLSTWSDMDGGVESTQLFIGPYYTYTHYIDTRSTIYGGPHLGLTYISFDAPGFDDSETVFAYGLHVGYRHWITPAVSFNVEPRWTHSDFDDDLGGDTDQYDILFGFSVLF